LEIFDDELPVMMDPARNAQQEKGWGIHGEIIPLASPRGEHFIGKHTLPAACKDRDCQLI